MCVSKEMLLDGMKVSRAYNFFNLFTVVSCMLLSCLFIFFITCCTDVYANVLM